MASFGRESRSGSVRSNKSSKNSFEDKSSEYQCPICFHLIEEAHITKCGHTFCYSCISKAIETIGKCPKCNFALTSLEHIIPNFLLNDLIVKHKSKVNGLNALGVPKDTGGELTGPVDGLRDFVASESQHLSLPDVNVMLEVLTQRKHLLEAESCAAQNKLLHEFLKQLLQQREEQKNQLMKEVSLIKSDINEVEMILKEVHEKCPTLEQVEKCCGISENSNKVVTMKNEMINLIDTIGSTLNKSDNPSAKDSSNLAQRRRRMQSYFDDFVQCYFSLRSKDLFFKEQTSSGSTKCSAAEAVLSGLDQFRENLIKFSRYSILRPLATLNYSSDLFNNSTIVSSIEFDKDNELFAIAGVTKRIKVFDYSAVIRDNVDIHYPCVEMVSNSKISCVSWNTYHKSVLASSDYEGTVTVWDASTGQRTKTFQEHEKRCWSVDFNDVDTRLIASGSDDARVKLWSLNIEHSVATLEAKANVCCVKFNPRSSCHLAFGSADHCVHYYDLRSMKEALAVFKGHRKAVSYVKFINVEDIVSASTDSQLKMWNINTPYCLRSFVGHTNEKNFVGLATDGDYIACGSENNALYIYYKGLTKQLFSYKFDAVRSVVEHDRKDDEPNEFVSAVCWRQHSNVVVAANSQGTIKILELAYASNGELKHQRPYTLWNLCSNYHSVTVVSIGEPAIAYDDLEELDERKEAVRNAAHVGLQTFKSLGIKNIEFDDMGSPEATAEGAVLSSFHFDTFKKEKAPKLTIAPFQNQSSQEWKKGVIKASAQNTARLMMDMPSNFKAPTKFAEIVKTELEGTNVKLEIRDEKWIEDKKMGGLLSVSRGSDEPAVFLEMTYRGASKGDPIVLVGKGVTFDAGGYALKPWKDMDKMRVDCGGACCVVATMRAVSDLKLPINVVGLAPLTENLISGKATKPGDVITMMNGKTVAVDNPDAEGRLILGDALTYSATFNPRFVLDIATLTGAIVVSLGPNCTGVFTNSYPYWQSLRQAGAQSGDRMWRMPLWKCHTKYVSEYSAYDVSNVGTGQGGASCTAAAFLREFVPSGVEWAHLDIAGVAVGPTDDGVVGRGMTGKPTRTLIYFLELLSRFEYRKNA